MNLVRKLLKRLKGHYKNGGLKSLFSLFLGILQCIFKGVIFSYKNNGKYKCSCCGWQGNQFKPYFAIGYTSLNVSCPNCGAHSRHRGHGLYYERNINIYNECGKLLYIAPEEGVIKSFMGNKKLDIITSDFEQEANSDEHFDIMNITCENNSFDFIICHRVIEHVSDDRKAMNEIYRVLKPGGLAIVSVPIKFDLDKTIEFGKPNPLLDEHYYYYGLDFKDRIPKDITYCEVQFSKIFSQDEMKTYHINDDFIFEFKK